MAKKDRNMIILAWSASKLKNWQEIVSSKKISGEKLIKIIKKYDKTLII